MDPINDKNAQPASTAVYTDLRADILSGVIADGSRLTEQSVCTKYKVSRTPVREAFRQLEADGLIENVPNRGAFVTGLSRRDVSDLFDLRTLFEVQAVEWAVKRMSDEEIEKLSESMDFMEFYTLRNDIEKVLSFNSQFHSIIYSGTKDRMLQRTLTVYQTYLKHSVPAGTYSEDQLKEIFREHKAIFDGIKSRNVAAGRSAMQHHMENSKIRRISGFF
ncbi:MAG: GntR family transcriptional regulator [Mogibacterium sp.]|nr:GntR family transcriptional regulator [Mogibacterium sp.]